MHVPLLMDVLIIFGLSIVVLYLCHLIHLPAMVGFIVTGVVAGPHGLALISAAAEVEVLAELGVILLLFSIGMEFSLARLVQFRRLVLLGGGLQVVVTAAVVYGAARAFGLSAGPAAFTSFIMALSSTAIVLHLAQERAEVDTLHGNAMLSILIFQDLAVIPFILALPILAGTDADITHALGALLLKGAGVILFLFVAARYLAPRLFFQIARTRNQALFLLAVIVLCLGVAWGAAAAGMSLALGAFLAGMVIADSEYSHQALGNVLPFRDAFSSLFFVSIGMLLDLNLFLERPLLILAATAVLYLGKSAIAGAASLAAGLPARAAVLAGVSLGQTGEFFFVLTQLGAEQGLIAPDTYQFLLAVTVVSMAVTPFVMNGGPALANALFRHPWPARLASSPEDEDRAAESSADHLIIVGFGLNGRNLARAADFAGIPHRIIETNAQTVKAEREKGVPISYGDATNLAVLEHAGLDKARIVVVAINDPVATRRIAATVRRHNPKVHLIVRSRFLQEMEPLRKLGADQIIPEEFETSVEIFTRVLMKYLVPRRTIEKFIAQLRADGYEILRGPPPGREPFESLEPHLADLEISAVEVCEGSPLANKTLAETALRTRFGVTVLAVRSEGAVSPNPSGEMRIKAGDILYVFGEPDRVFEVGCELDARGREEGEKA